MRNMIISFREKFYCRLVYILYRTVCKSATLHCCYIVYLQHGGDNSCRGYSRCVELDVSTSIHWYSDCLIGFAWLCRVLGSIGSFAVDIGALISGSGYSVQRLGSISVINLKPMCVFFPDIVDISCTNSLYRPSTVPPTHTLVIGRTISLLVRNVTPANCGLLKDFFIVMRIYASAGLSYAMRHDSAAGLWLLNDLLTC